MTVTVRPLLSPLPRNEGMVTAPSSSERGAGAQDTVARIEQSKREREADQAFLNGLDKLHGQGRNVSESAYAKTYAPKFIAALPSCGFKKRDLEQAMERLFDQGAIEVGEVGTTKDRKKQHGIRRVEHSPKPQETGEN